MSTPTRTTFEVKISNKLQQQSIWVKIAAELNYATQLQSSSQQHKTQNIYNKTAFSNNIYNKTNRESTDYSDKKTHNKSTTASSNSNSSSYSTSQASSNSASTNVNAGASNGLFSAKLNVSHNKTNQSTSNSSGSSSSSASYYENKDNLQHNISKQDRKALDENATSDNNLTEESKENMHRNDVSSSAILKNRIIDPGFVRITPFQILSIPVIVENESQVVYVTVYCMNEQDEKLVIANQLQINRQLIEIRRNKMTNDIEIAPESETKGKFSDFRTLLLEWGIPEYLCDAMKNSGWHNKQLWYAITDQDLDKMGFKRGHREIFHYEYTKWKMTTHRIKKKLSYKDLLSKWEIPIHLYGNMKENGWDDVRLWNKLIDSNEQKNNYKQLKDMGFKMGHIEKFKLYVNDKQDHIKQFEQMQKDLEQNKTNTIINYDEDDAYEEELKLEYELPEIPIFTVSEDRIYHNSFDLELNAIKKSEIYVVEMNDNINKKWKIVAEITQTKTHRIEGLKMNTMYSIRMRAQTAFKKRSDYSKVIKIKTKDEHWQKQNLPTLPKFNYDIYNNNAVIFIEFDSLGVDEIINTQYNEKYEIFVGLNKESKTDDEKQEKIKWKSLCCLNKNKLIYQLN
eukprot:474_1